MYNLMKLDGEGAQDACQHDVVQHGPIGGRVNDVGEDVIIQATATECEEDEVTPLLVVGREGLQNYRNHRLNVLDACSVRV
jgi:hypothetical protein